tara:strand:+ start:142 stop:1191 length:1050 start_codon:yes stop_codon:yes gene_type:complete
LNNRANQNHPGVIMTGMSISTYPLNKKDGDSRLIGVELEFTSLMLRPATEIVSDFLNSETIEYIHDNYAKIPSKYGDFRVFVDFERLLKLSREVKNHKKDDFSSQMQEFAKKVLEDLSEGVVPLEIVTPPIPIEYLKELDKIADVLALNGAKGTHLSPLYAFGLHFNPDVPDLNTETLLAYVQAFALLEPYLKEKVHPDISRSVTQYAAFYPSGYNNLILNEGYLPEQSQFIDDYLKYNPTRNRALDMLPCLSMLEEEKIKYVTKGDTLIKKRPTFHYRLPDCRIGDGNWSIEKEWEIWEVVELVANNHDLRQKLIQLYKGRSLFTFVTKSYLKAIKKCLLENQISVRS